MATLKSLFETLKNAGLDPNRVVTFHADMRLDPKLFINELKGAGFKPNKVVRYNIPINPPPSEPKPDRNKHKPKKGGNK